MNTDVGLRFAKFASSPCMVSNYRHLPGLIKLLTNDHRGQVMLNLGYFNFESTKLFSIVFTEKGRIVSLQSIFIYKRNSRRDETYESYLIIISQIDIIMKWKSSCFGFENFVTSRFKAIFEKSMGRLKKNIYYLYIDSDELGTYFWLFVLLSSAVNFQKKNRFICNQPFYRFLINFGIDF